MDARMIHVIVPNDCKLIFLSYTLINKHLQMVSQSMDGGGGGGMANFLAYIKILYT